MRRPIAVVFMLAMTVLGARCAWSDDDFDVRHYEIRVQPDTVAKVLTIDTALQIANPSRLSRFAFRLSPRFSTVSADINGTTAAVSRVPGGIEIISTHPAPARFVMHIHARGVLGNSDDEDRPVITDDDVFLLWSDHWYPSHSNDWATVRTMVVVPAGFLAIGPGVLRKTTRTANGVEFSFEKRDPAENFSVFADRGWKLRQRTVHGIRIRTLLHAESDHLADKIFDSSADVIRYFKRLHGFVPFEEFSFITLRRMYARRAFTDFVGYEPSYLEREMTRTGYDAHETSLLWWLYATHGRGPGSFQWTEGLGDYVEVMYAESAGKPLASIFATFRQQYLNMPASQDVTFRNLRGNTPQEIVHGKYPWAMQVLRDAIGDTAFRRGIQRLFSKYRYRAYTMDDFIATFEEASGSSLQWWRVEWLERQGVPEIAMQVTTPSGSPDQITCRLSYLGEVYHLPLDIGIQTRTGMQVKRVLFQQPEQSFTFHVSQPTGAVLDPNNRLLLRKRDDK